MDKFQLSEKFIDKYKRKKAPFGFNGLGELVYMRTYSRIKENGKNERWWETVQRVVEGTYTMQKNWIESHQLGWNAWQAQNEVLTSWPWFVGYGNTCDRRKRIIRSSK